MGAKQTDFDKEYSEFIGEAKDDEVIPVEELEEGDENKQKQELESDEKKKESETDQLKRELAELREALKLATIKEIPEVEKKSLEIEPIKPALVDINLFDDVDPNEMMSDIDEFKKGMVSIITKVRKTTQDEMLQMMYQNIPGIVQKNVIEQVEGKEAANKFYSENEDLKEHKQDVVSMAKFIHANYPELSGDKFYEKLANLTRANLGLVKNVKDNVNEKPGKTVKPALNNRSIKGVRGPAVEQTAMEKEIEDLLAVI